jgi:cytochrome c
VIRASRLSKALLSSFMRVVITMCLIAAGMAATTVDAQDALHSVWVGVYTAGQAQRGAAVFATQCVTCHGENLTGDGAEVPALTGKMFLYKWDSLALQALFDLIHTAMPLSNPGTLSGQESADLTAYILSMNQIPAGATELSDNAQSLQNIRFDAKRPDH